MTDIRAVNEHTGQITAAFVDPHALTRRDQTRLECMRLAIAFCANVRKMTGSPPAEVDLIDVANRIEAWVTSK